MPFVLTKASRVSCVHGGVVATESTAPLTVQGSPVLLRGGIEGKGFGSPGCPTPEAKDNSGPTASPCTAVANVPSGPGISAGASTVLTIGGQPVMLDTLAGVTNGMVTKVTPQPGLAATAIQAALTAS